MTNEEFNRWVNDFERQDAIFLLDVATSSPVAIKGYDGAGFIEICDTFEIGLNAYNMACAALADASAALGVDGNIQEYLAEAAAMLREGWTP